jgi:hypothetical protein
MSIWVSVQLRSSEFSSLANGLTEAVVESFQKQKKGLLECEFDGFEEQLQPR